MRVATFVLVLAAIALAAWKGNAALEKRRVSPFQVWGLRAGMPFTEADELMMREEKRRFTCNVIVGANRLCRVRVSGIHATVRVLVDERGRVAVLAFHPDSESVLLREEGRKMSAEWHMVRPGEAATLEEPGDDERIVRWASADTNWSAAMQYGRFGAAPTVIRVTDERSLERISTSAPLARLVLRMNGLEKASAEETYLEVLRLSRAPDLITEEFTPAPVSPLRELPLCASPIPELPIRAAEGQERFSPPEASRAGDIIAAAYPGWRLFVGRGVWMTDPSGRSERAALDVAAANSADSVVAFAMEFPARGKVSGERLESRDTTTHCRAPADIIVARRSDDGALAGVRRIPVDNEAIASEIFRLDNVGLRDDGRGVLLIVEYGGAYGTDRWVGALSWLAAITVPFADSASLSVRIPRHFSFGGGKSKGETEGVLTVTGMPAGGVELTTFEERPWGVASRTIVVPLDASGALRGTTLLDKLYQP